MLQFWCIFLRILHLNLTFITPPPPLRIAFASCNLDFISQNSELTFHNSTFTSCNFDSPPPPPLRTEFASCNYDILVYISFVWHLWEFWVSISFFVACNDSVIFLRILHSHLWEFPSRNRVVPLRILSSCLVILMYFSRIVNVYFANVDFILRIIIFQIVHFCQFFLLGNSV